MKVKEYKMEDLFKMSWSALSIDEMATVIACRQSIIEARDNGRVGLFGHAAIELLKALRKHKAVSYINEEQVVACVNDIKFIHEPWYFFPSQEFGVDTFSTPDEYLSNRSFVQLVFADSLFTKYLLQDYLDRQAHPSRDPSIEAEAYLNCFLAVIYTNTKSFDKTRIEKDAKIISKALTGNEKFVAIHTYANVMDYIITKRCPVLFGQNADAEEAPPKKEVAPKYSGEQWQALLFDLSETNAFMGLDKAENALMYDALDYLEKKSKESKSKQKNA